MIQTEWTKERVRELLATTDQAVVNAIKQLYALQTFDEQDHEQTSYVNSKGFNALDAKFMSSLAKQIEQWENTMEGSRYPFPLSYKQLFAARRRLLKYSGQLVKIANKEK